MSRSLPAWARPSSDGSRISITLHVQPNARTSAVAGRHGDALKVRVAAPPSDDRANQALLELLGRSLGVARSALSIRHGLASRRKIVEIAADADRMAERLRLLDQDLT